MTGFIIKIISIGMQLLLVIRPLDYKTYYAFISTGRIDFVFLIVGFLTFMRRINFMLS